MLASSDGGQPADGHAPRGLALHVPEHKPIRFRFFAPRIDRAEQHLGFPIPIFRFTKYPQACKAFTGREDIKGTMASAERLPKQICRG